jgi:hypothetical protein
MKKIILIILVIFITSACSINKDLVEKENRALKYLNKKINGKKIQNV